MRKGWTSNPALRLKAILKVLLLSIMLDITKIKKALKYYCVLI